MATSMALTGYLQCLNNEQPVPDSCDYFKWRNDIHRGKTTDRKESKKTGCAGVLCRQSGKSNPINVECTFGVCVHCCRHSQPLLPTMRACCVSDHRKGVIYPGQTTAGKVMTTSIAHHQASSNAAYRRLAGGGAF